MAFDRQTTLISSLKALPIRSTFFSQFASCGGMKWKKILGDSLVSKAPKRFASGFITIFSEWQGSFHRWSPTGLMLIFWLSVVDTSLVAYSAVTIRSTGAALLWLSVRGTCTGRIGSDRRSSCHCHRRSPIDTLPLIFWLSVVDTSLVARSAVAISSTGAALLWLCCCGLLRHGRCCYQCGGAWVLRWKLANYFFIQIFENN